MQKPIYLFLVLLVFSPHLALADSSWFHKLSVLRFASEKTVQAVEGTVDLQGLGTNEYYHVQGDVLFFPGEFLTPTWYSADEFAQLTKNKHPLKAPLRLKSFPHTMESSPVNFGTFVVRIENTAPRQLLLSIPRFYHPIDLYLASANESRRLLSLGERDTNPEANTNLYSFSTSNAVVDVKGDFYLFAQVSSPAPSGKTNTLNFSSFYLGEERYLSHALYSNRYFPIGISGGFLILFVFYFFIYLFRLRDKSSLYLSIYALCSYGMSLLYVVEFPVSAALVGELFITINVMSVCFLQFYLLEKIDFLFSRRLKRSIQIFALLTVAGTSVALSQQASVLTATFFFCSFLSSSALIAATIYFGFRHRLNGIPFFLAGTIINSFFQLFTMMSFIAQANQENGYTVLLANFFMALALALVNAKEFAVTYEEISFLNKNLERLVDHKTKEVRALLDSIPQGVLSIGVDGLIEKDFSAHLSTILETDHIAAQSVKTLLLDPCDMSSDVKDQTWQSILASLGDSALNFDLNESKLPRELIYRVNGRVKYLKATWNIEEEADIVVRILVTLLDVTSEKLLEKASEKQRQELVLIQELIDVSPNRMSQFFSTSLPLLRECERIITVDQTELSSHRVLMLFVNAHTMKGSARTLQLKELAAALHTMEEHYADVLRKGMPLDTQRLLSDFQHTRQIFQAYLDVNRNKLHRTDDSNRILMERDFIEQHYQVLKELATRPGTSLADCVRKLQEQTEALTLVIFEQLPAVFEDYKDRALKIAKDLGKAEPLFKFNIAPLPVSSDRRTVLDNCMIHLLRNAMDHGIECPNVRREKRKPEGGVISVDAEAVGDQLKVRLRDDGRGLAINLLREKGLRIGALQNDSGLQDVADLIFSNGVSTARQLSDISGRGVGMNAVRTFLEQVGGSIRVDVGAPTDESQQYYQFTLEITLPLTPLARSA